MTKGVSWLADVVLVNESNTISVPGDVGVFRSVGDACGYLEPWWVENREGFVLTATGEHLVLGVGNGRVFPVRREPIPEGAILLVRWLAAAASAVLVARRERARLGRAVLSPSEQEGTLPTSVEGLLAYVGFET